MLENPALKLHSLIEKTYNESFKNDSYKLVWARTFNVDKDDTISLMNNIIGLINLYTETKKLVEQNERLNNVKNQNFLHNIGNAILTIDFEGYINNFRENLNQETLTALSYIGDSLNFVYDLNESKVDNKKLDEILDEVNNLVQSIAESLLPKDVQNILINNLIIIKDALYRYKFLGEYELRKALEQTIGSIAINKSIIDQNQDDSIYPRFGSVLGKVSSLITIGTAVKDYLLPLFNKQTIE